MSTAKLTVRIKPYSRFREYREQQEKQRQGEPWAESFLIDELCIKLMSVKEKDNEGIWRRKYQEQVRKKMYWMPIPPHTTVIVVSIKDLDAKIIQELSSHDKISQDFVLREAVGMICETVDSRFYLLSAMPYLKVELEK